MLDISDTLAAKSDQLNADDLIGGPITVTVERVARTNDEQPIAIHLVEAKPYKPCKSMRRVLAAVWGPDAATWEGRRMTLYRDPTVRFGGMDVGGIRVSHVSHIDRPMTLTIMVSKGKKAPCTLHPLVESTDGLDALAAAIADLGIDDDLLNHWHVTKGKGPLAEISDGQAGDLAAYLRRPTSADLVAKLKGGAK